MKTIKSILTLILVANSFLSADYAAINEKQIFIVTPTYNNKDSWERNLLESISQDYSNYHIIITDDCSTDGTCEAIENYIRENHLEHKVTLICNKERRGALYNLYTMIHRCPNEAIIVTVDGDDWLADHEVLKRLNYYYSTYDIWLTYGQFKEYPSGATGWCTPMPDHIVAKNAFREFHHIPSHLRTFYAWLFKAIKLEDMLYFGEFYRMTWDYVMMLPMIEMSGERHLCLQNDITYIYNNANSISDHRISRQLQAHLAQIVRKKERYKCLSEKYENPTKDYENELVDCIIFSEDKDPFALEQFIKVFFEKVTGIGDVYVLYHPSRINQQDYNELAENILQVHFFEIEEYRSNFRPLLKEIYGNLKRKYVLFGRSNVQINQPINLHDCVMALEETQAYSFSLKLSKENPNVKISDRLILLELGPDLCAWDFSTANDAWSCANCVDCSIYRKTIDIAKVLDEGYMEPSSQGFQMLWANEGNLNKVGLCFKFPKTSAIAHPKGI